MQAALNTSVLNRVILAVERTINVGSRGVVSETRLVGDLLLSGLGRIKLAMSLEEVFDIELPDEVLERFATIADIVKYVDGHYFRDVETSDLVEAA